MTTAPVVDVLSVPAGVVPYESGRRTARVVLKLASPMGEASTVT